MKSFAVRLGLCVLPLCLTPVWGFLLAEDYLSAGGGCKDILLVIPWFVWSFLYAAVFVVLWIMRRPLKKLCAYSFGIATLILAAVWLVLVALAPYIAGVQYPAPQ